MEADIINLNTDPNSPINQVDDNIPLEKAIHCKQCTEYRDLDDNILDPHELELYNVEKGFCCDDCETDFNEDKILAKIKRNESIIDYLKNKNTKLYSEIGITYEKIIYSGFTIDLDMVINESCDIFGIDEEVLTGSYRGDNLPKYRSIVMKILYELTKKNNSQSLSKIADRFGYKSHGSVITGAKLYDNLFWQKDTEWMADYYDDITCRIVANFKKLKP